MTPLLPDRREFLKATGLFVFFLAEAPEALQAPARPAGRPSSPADFNAYLPIKADGRVTCFSGKVEMGQGPATSLAQLLAEELDVPLASVDVVLGDTDLCPWDMGTFGSLTVRQFGPVLRQAAAEARAVLVQMAAERLEVPVERLVVTDGVVSDRDNRSARVTYAQLTEGRRIERRLDTKPALEPVERFTIVGRPAKRRDAVEKVTGAARFAGDIVPPGGALHARILRPPAHGARLASVDVSAAETRPGVTVVRDGDLVAVLHPHWDEADRALAEVKAEFVRQDPPVDDRTIFDHLVKTAPTPRTAAEGGSLAEGEARAAHKVERTWLDSYVAHAPIEPHAAVAAVEDGKVTVWASTQTPFPLKNQIAEALKLSPEKVRVITPYVGGGFGGKTASRQGLEAARLAVLAGKPVRVLWNREEEFFYDTFRPASVIRIRSGLDHEGRIAFWDYDVVAAGDRGAAHSTPSRITRRRFAAAGPGASHPASTPSRWGRGAPPAPTPTPSRANRTSICSRRRPRPTRSSSGDGTSKTDG